jgi:hypothetical protein
LKTQLSKKENKLRKSNKKITISGKSALRILTEVEYMMISMRNIAIHYYDNVDDPENVDPIAYANEITNFVDDQKVVERLCSIRRILSERFDHKVGKDDMDDTERAMENLPYWKTPKT